MITFTQLHYYLEVAKQKSFTKAANNLYITQQTLSNHISTIEQTLGAKLFERTTPLSLPMPENDFWTMRTVWFKRKQK